MGSLGLLKMRTLCLAWHHRGGGGFDPAVEAPAAPFVGLAGASCEPKMYEYRLPCDPASLGTPYDVGRGGGPGGAGSSFPLNNAEYRLPCDPASLGRPYDAGWGGAAGVVGVAGAAAVPGVAAAAGAAAAPGVEALPDVVGPSLRPNNMEYTLPCDPASLGTPYAVGRAGTEPDSDIGPAQPAISTAASAPIAPKRPMSCVIQDPPRTCSVLD